MQLEILHNEDEKEYEEMVTEEAEAEDWNGSLMRAAGLGSFRADGGQFLSENQAYKVQTRRSKEWIGIRREVGEERGKRQKKKMNNKEEERKEAKLDAK